MSIAQSSQTTAPVESNRSGAILEAVHLRKDFPLAARHPFAKAQVVHAVEDASIALYPGHATALVGESGSGKTTVARMLARLYDPTAGQMFFQGQTVDPKSGRDLRDFRSKVQLIFQDPFSSLNPVHDVLYHLSRPMQVHGYARGHGEIVEQALTLLNRVSLTPAEQFIQKFPHQLSGGQRQRVAIARALAVRPQVLLADEPVSMLDVSIRLDILNLLLRLKDEEHLALLFITHNLGLVAQLCDAVAVMYAGAVIERGPVAGVTTAPRHPYTVRLIACELDAGASNTTIATIPGDVPDPAEHPPGCLFAARCTLAEPRCDTPQVLRSVAPDWDVACWKA